MTAHRAGGAPEEIRTPDPQIRSLVLYPAELRAHAHRARDVSRRNGSADRAHSYSFHYAMARLHGSMSPGQ
jgi:hypothetical protein